MTFSASNRRVVIVGAGAAGDAAAEALRKAGFDAPSSLSGTLGAPRGFALVH